MTAPGRVRVTGIEAVQSVQTADSQVPLIANKRTFVRVYGESTEDSRGPWTDVVAFLSVEGSTEWRGPINAGGPTITISPTGSDRSSLTDSFLFELNSEEVTVGLRSLTVRLFPPGGRPQSDISGNSSTASLQFGPPGDPITYRVYGARYRYTNVPQDIQTANHLAAQPGPSGPCRRTRLTVRWLSRRCPLRRSRSNLGP